eukprot:CAMPEP_0119103792 /NCGR_PEP_ID=MMETSP1180-20130426/2167_1 /TAXON_ID=3052 ORGANISM="Chlamydomonas cf sp, Strain CCMP681" /NCGR_SAMPLE_ID=MMETSP1180 /ASSEMBLY_ACC=CAM_ASM_000741 /LENGTH=797 /DNA_ID=CAMNT_0007088383 /DNA_START=241 /DNA_END=2634 /DNA_ORIENTATION=+
MSMADFGRPLYGASLIGRLVYPSEDVAYNPTGKPLRCPGSPCQYACNDLSMAQPPFSIAKQPGQFFIMLVDRGPRDALEPCYFLKKVYNAQMAGADAVLVANDENGDLSTAIVPDDEPAVANLVDSLRISAALVSMSDAIMLKGLLKNQASVTLALNWTNVLPKQSTVTWEFWHSTNDQCGAVCQDQKAFLASMKNVARALEQTGQLVFSPHFLLWSCPEDYAQSDECKNECILNGTYCVPDPDGSLEQGYSGKDVLAMNVRSMCFAKIAREASKSWLWWDFADQLSINCSSQASMFDSACAQQVFDRVEPLLLDTQSGTKWQACITNATAPANATRGTTLDLLEQELNLQAGTNGQDSVSILPTIRINGKQYRGSLEVGGVMRALCSGYPTDQEPSVCNEKWVTGENECDPAGVGHANCHVGDPLAGGRTRCTNTFSGYQCECGAGWLRSSKVDTGDEVCEDINECLATNIRFTDPDCGCDRCACINLIGGYNCTGPLPDNCTPEHDYGGCWKATVEGQFQHACKDTIQDYKRLAARGVIAPDSSLFSCTCPGCFAATVGLGSAENPVCQGQCPLSKCMDGACKADPAPIPSSGGGGGGGKSTGGMSGGGVLLTVLLTVGLSAGGFYAVYHLVLRQRMQGEVRDIMSQYMPIGKGRGGNGTGGGPGSRGGRGLDPVDEEEEEGEDAPLLAPTGANGRAHTNTFGAAPGSAAPVNGGGSSGRTAFGSLAVAPAAALARAFDPPTAGRADSRVGGYQPPALPEFEEEARVELPTRIAAAVHQPVKVQSASPLLGDGPL